MRAGANRKVSVGAATPSEQPSPVRPWRVLNIPISPGAIAQVGFPLPFTRAEWEQFANVLTAMEPGIVSDGDEPSDGEA